MCPEGISQSLVHGTCPLRFSAQNIFFFNCREISNIKFYLVNNWCSQTILQKNSKPFNSSYKVFKEHFFKVVLSSIRFFFF